MIKNPVFIATTAIIAGAIIMIASLHHIKFKKTDSNFRQNLINPEKVEYEIKIS